MPTSVKFAVVVLAALALTALPGGGGLLEVVLTLLTIVFLTVLAWFGYRLFRQHRFELGSLPERSRLVLYSSVGLAVLTVCATGRLFDGVGVLVWLALLGLCAFGIYRVWVDYRAVA